LFRGLPRFLKEQGKTRKGGSRMEHERLLRPREVARRLGISRSSVYRWFWEGKLRGIKLLGGPVRILESSVILQLSQADFGFE
jgi:excisionase family DNA binding protein